MRHAAGLRVPPRCRGRGEVGDSVVRARQVVVQRPRGALLPAFVPSALVDRMAEPGNLQQLRHRVVGPRRVHRRRARVPRHTQDVHQLIQEAQGGQRWRDIRGRPDLLDLRHQPLEGQPVLAAHDAGEDALQLAQRTEVAADQAVDLLALGVPQHPAGRAVQHPAELPVPPVRDRRPRIALALPQVGEELPVS